MQALEMDCIGVVLCKSVLKMGEFPKHVHENFCGPKSKEDEEPLKARDKFKRSPGHAISS